MRNFTVIFLFVFFSIPLGAQEMNCVVTVNADQVSQTNTQIAKTLERSLTDFVNKTEWTNQIYQENERVNARMFITVTNYDNNRFKATVQLQSNRPVFNTSYESPVFNYKDNQFDFEYIEFQPLTYNENTFDSNLIGVVSYYVYIMLGLDADTFAIEGGTPYFKQAQKIGDQAQGNNVAGWNQSTSDRTRFELVDNILSNTHREYRVAMYNYHRKGLDIMADNNSAGKQVIAGSMRLLETL